MGLVLLWWVLTQAQTPVQIDPSEQYLATIDKLQGHLNLCIQDAGREQAARKRLQAELEQLKAEQLKKDKEKPDGR